MDKGSKGKLAGSPAENGGGWDRIGRDEMKRKTQERMERKRSSNAGSEKMERVGDRLGKMERYYSTGQSPQRAVAPTEEEGMFWAATCPSSGELIVLIRHLVYVTMYKCYCLVCRFGSYPNLHAKRSSIQSDIYQMLY